MMSLQSGGLEKVLVLSLEGLGILLLHSVTVPTAIVLQVEPSTLVDNLQPVLLSAQTPSETVSIGTDWVATWLWKRPNVINSTHTPGGKAKSR